MFINHFYFVLCIVKADSNGAIRSVISVKIYCFLSYCFDKLSPIA